MTDISCPVDQLLRRHRAGPARPDYPGLRPVPGQRLTFHPNFSFRGPQVLRVQSS